MLDDFRDKTGAANKSELIAKLYESPRDYE